MATCGKENRNNTRLQLKMKMYEADICDELNLEYRESMHKMRTRVHCVLFRVKSDASLSFEGRALRVKRFTFSEKFAMENQIAVVMDSHKRMRLREDIGAALYKEGFWYNIMPVRHVDKFCQIYLEKPVIYHDVAEILLELL